MAIPAILHQTAPRDEGRWDPRWGRCYESWGRVCSGVRRILWDDEGLRALVQEAFPEHLPTYDSYEHQIQRVDFARAAMLFIHGGLYADMDVEALDNPFPHLPAGVSIVASPYVENEKHQNSLMASPAGHPFWRAVAAEAVRRRAAPKLYRTTWQLTGPQLLDAVVERYGSDVHVLPADVFNPSMSSPSFHAPQVITRHLCTSVWTHDMDNLGMALYQAARASNAAAAQRAADAKADLDCRDYAGLTPLHHAAIKGDVAMVSLLSRLRADVSAKDKNATTPLHYAVQMSHFETVKLLLHTGAAADVRLLEGPYKGATPLELAADMHRSQQSPSSGEVLGLLQLHDHAAAKISEDVRRRAMSRCRGRFAICASRRGAWPAARREGRLLEVD
ncbi:unnamed protein product [Symbiodinium sp. CCMP2456]|nr:unnamed protein product [Symbiodinium sp. CCMP2456]